MTQVAARELPDARGFFGQFGGRYVPETLVPALDELEQSFQRLRHDPRFNRELSRFLDTYAGRPTPTYHAARLSAQLGGAQIYLKREDLAHTGAHKINNALGQGLLAKHSGKRRVIGRDGCWPARRGRGHRLRHARPRVRCVHG